MAPKYEHTVATLTTAITLARMIVLAAASDELVVDKIEGTALDSAAISDAVDSYCSAALLNHLTQARVGANTPV